MAMSRKTKRRLRKFKEKWGTSLGGAFLGLAVLLGGIGFIVSDATDTKVLASCLLLIDQTGSSMDDETRDSYNELAGHALEGCESLEAEVAIYFFDQERARVMDAAGGPINLKRNGQTTAAKDVVSDVLAGAASPNRGSDILVPLDQAADELQIMRRRAGTSSAHLIVLTDGIQCGTEICVDQLTPDPASASPLLERATEMALVPDLVDIEVDFVGVRSGKLSESESSEDWFEASLEVFWQALIHDGQGAMCRYGSTATELPTRC